MKKSLLFTLLAVLPLILFAQGETADEDLSDLFLTYWPVILLPIFMIVIFRYYRKRRR
ncbi:hypothetical protein KIH41_10570 [Litoribacter ruber]|uniref:Uncharacterized protein n=1 Tax=Litoribacter ruber TaxID=702568 RepID=A0AAP2CK56_9BACT|nr:MULTISPECIES: hypothetical protein [Litoribacter]MBS9525234.1 hypothetical protein [Litoribacter alkaliphilus]MBT0811719.1 hypothetical protein [Litoribacter ruber]